MINISTLKDLVKINLDRMQDYNKAVIQTTNETLQYLFEKISSQSKTFACELNRFLWSEGINPEEGNYSNGKIYKDWSRLKAGFHLEKKYGFLDTIIQQEEIALLVYDEALQQQDITSDLRQTISTQKKLLDEAYVQVQRMQEANAA